MKQREAPLVVGRPFLFLPGFCDESHVFQIKLNECDLLVVSFLDFDVRMIFVKIKRLVLR